MTIFRLRQLAELWVTSDEEQPTFCQQYGLSVRTLQRKLALARKQGIPTWRVHTPLEVPQAAWLAGFIDGDGCISLSSNGRGTKMPELCAVSCDREILEHIKSLVGGSITNKPRYKENCRPAWSWSIKSSNRVIAILEDIYPYIKCEFKRKRAHLIIEQWRGITNLGGSYTPELAQTKLEFEKTFFDLGFGRGRRRRAEMVK